MKIALVDSGLGLLYLLKKIIDNNIKHEIDLLFTSIFPLGDFSKEDIYTEVDSLIERIDANNYDKVFIMCNTLSCFFINKDEYIKILDFNKNYLKENKNTIPIGTKHTIEYLKKGYIENNLARDIENGDIKNIYNDISKWPKGKEYLLCCTHYILVKNKILELHPNSKVIDLSDEIFKLIENLTQSESLTIDYGSKEKLIKKSLKF